MKCVKCDKDAEYIFNGRSLCKACKECISKASSAPVKYIPSPTYYVPGIRV